ncbi:MAG TPA: hypothetical protein VMF06_23185 [Candidatus Limnocylindria bacterium]|jgi:hypothetical protein|nr:hypothetical protein [Candidatus Limnocylindria bacterium]
MSTNSWAAVRAAVTTNIALTVIPHVLGGVVYRSIFGAEPGDYLLLTGQTAPAQNGIYQPDSGSDLVTPDGELAFDGDGEHAITTTAGARIVLLLAAGETLTVGSTVYSTTLESGETFEFAAAASMTLAGEDDAVIRSQVSTVTLTRADDPGYLAEHSQDFINGKTVAVTDGTAPGLYQYTGATNPTLGTTAITFALLGAFTASLLPPCIAHVGVAGNFNIDGTQPPTLTPPTSPVLVDAAYTLLPGNNYSVKCSTRSGPVTVTLPASPTVGQRIEVIDDSGQAATYNITVAGNGHYIGVAETTNLVISDTNAVLAILWTGSHWHII